jgi:hypothetical protein
MDQPDFRDDLFDNAEGDWVQCYADEHFRQRYLRSAVRRKLYGV